MGNAAWGAGYHTGMEEGFAIGKAAGVKKGVVIGVAAASAVVGLRKLAPWRLVSKHPLDRDQDPAAMDSNPVAEKGVEDKQEAREGTPSE